MKTTSHIIAAALWVACVLLIGYCLYLLNTPTAISMPQIQAKSEQQGTSSEQKSTNKSISAYANITARPLFHADRKAVDNASPAPVIQEDKTPQSPDFKLIGVILDNDIAMALVRLKNNNVKRVYTGSIIDHWRIKEIRRKSIVVNNKEKDWIMTMEKPSSKPNVATGQQQNEQPP